MLALAAALRRVLSCLQISEAMEHSSAVGTGDGGRNYLTAALGLGLGVGVGVGLGWVSAYVIQTQPIQPFGVSLSHWLQWTVGLPASAPRAALHKVRDAR